MRGMGRASRIVCLICFVVTAGMVACSSTDDTPTDPFSALAAENRDTARVSTDGANVPCFDSAETLVQYEDAVARSDDPDRDRALDHAQPLKVGEPVKFVDMIGSAAKIELTKRHSDCWEDANAKIFAHLHHRPD